MFIASFFLGSRRRKRFCCYCWWSSSICIPVLWKCEKPPCGSGGNGASFFWSIWFGTGEIPAFLTWNICVFGLPNLPWIFGVRSTFTKMKFIYEKTIQNHPNPILRSHFLNFQGGKSARIVDCVLALKSYHDWKQGGANGSWKNFGTWKPPVAGKQFVRRSSEPFVNPLPRSSSVSEKSLDGFSSEQFLNSDAGNDQSEMVSLLPYYKKIELSFLLYLYFAFWYAEYLSVFQFACPHSSFR